VVPSLPLRLRFSGRLLDRENPLSRVSQSSYERVTLLLSRIGESEFVEAVEGERFDASALGILRFDFTVVVNPRKRL
jgi:type IV pilus assembly protein PilM